jgi:dinuclear metal center YbgI/SA1388 family protein
MAQLVEIVDYLEAYLDAAAFDDYCPNGLQVEGRDRLQRLVTGVTACQALLDAAVAADADAVLVHHGYFWRGEDPRVVGMKRRRLQTLLGNGVSLLAYHLPLDAHPEVGNNAQLARRLELEPEGRVGGAAGREIAVYGRLKQPMSGDDFAALIERRLGRRPLHIEGPEPTVTRLAWCTGAAQGLIDEAATLGVDAYLTGEASEQTVHSAREQGLQFFAAGHHATERYGVQALGAHLAMHFGVEHLYVEVDNPV